jgi:hypothetical protein
MSSLKSLRVLAVAAVAMFSALSLAPRPAGAEPQALRGEATVTTTGGFGRIVIRLPVEVESQVRMSSNILVIQFKQPVDVPVDRLGSGASEYIGAARRDPDGKALRFALAQKVRISSMTAGERLFVDLLPQSWTGEPPGLPREVVEELAKRAHDAEQQARRRLALEQAKKIPPVPVRVASLPTFTRYIFELPELTGVTADRGKGRLTLSFAKPLRFDLSDAKLAQPKAVADVTASSTDDIATVRFALSQPVDIRTFREDSNFVVDVTPIDAQSAGSAKTGPLAGLVAPETTPAKSEAAEKSEPAKKSEAAEKSDAKPAAVSPPSAAASGSPAEPPPAQANAPIRSGWCSTPR